MDESGFFTEEITLSEGEHTISLVALDEQRNVAKQYITANYTPIAPSLANEILNSSKYDALIIGIEEYLDKQIPNLENPIKDAKLISEVLSSRYTFEKENISLLSNPTREELIVSFDKLSKTITPEDNLLIFYAGHGMWDESSGLGYWLPSDANLKSTANWFPNSTLVDYLKAIKSRHTLLIADAVFGSIYKTRGGFQDIEKAYKVLYDLPSRKAMTSGVLTEIPDKSSFTKYLIQRLKDNNERCLSSEQLFSSIRMAVINNSDAPPQFGKIRGAGDEGGDFIFLLKE